MSIDERAHDFAIEIMKLYFAENKEDFTDNTHSDIAVEIEKLFLTYNAAFKYAKEHS